MSRRLTMHGSTRFSVSSGCYATTWWGAWRPKVNKLFIPSLYGGSETPFNPTGASNVASASAYLLCLRVDSKQIKMSEELWSVNLQVCREWNSNLCSCGIWSSWASQWYDTRQRSHHVSAYDYISRLSGGVAPPFKQIKTDILMKFPFKLHPFLN